MRLGTGFVLIAALCIQVASAGELVDKMDRFTQKRKLAWMSSLRSSDPAAMGANTSVFFKGDEAVRVFVYLAGGFEKARFRSCDRTYWLADGQPVTAESYSYKQTDLDAPPVRKLELLTSVFTPAAFKQLASAQVVEYKVCESEGVVPAEDVEGLRQTLKAFDK